MGLIHWWPLNKDFNDYGCNTPISLSFSNTNTLSSGGKLGSCIDFDTVGKCTVLIPELNTKKVFSFAAWIYCYGATSVSGKDYSSQNWADLISFADGGDRLRFESGYNSPRVLSFHNNSAYKFIKSEVGGPVIIPTDGYIDSWHHFAFCCDGTNITTYRDGELIGTYQDALASTAALTGYLYINGEYNASTEYGYHGRLNDLRVYDHALTTKEVRDISKGLVLHYNFENINDNLLPAFPANASNGVSIDNTTHPFPGATVYKLTQSGNESNVYKGIDYTIPELKAGDLVTLSCWIYTENKASLDNGAELRIYQIHTDSTTNWSGINWRSSHVDGEWQFYSKTYTLDSNLSQAHFNCNVVRNGTYWITGIKVEYGDTATDYLGVKETLNTIYDNSGYSYNGIASSNLQISSLSCLGQKSAYFDGNSKIAVSYKTTGLDELTYSCWVYPLARASSGSASTCICIGGTYITITPAGYLSGYAYGKSPAGYHTGTTEIPLNEWTHIAIVWDKSYIYGYVNGEQDFKIACTGTFSQDISQQIGMEGSARQFTGYISDFKIYAASLSAEDILIEYQRKAAIDKNGNLYTSEIIENFDNLMEYTNYIVSTANSNWNAGYLIHIKETDYYAQYPDETKSGVGAYTQSNLSVTMTQNGLRIYSAPNLIYPDAGNTMWGGVVLTPMAHSNCLKDGHRYLITWHMSGQSSRYTDVQWSNWIGWGQAPNAAPTVNSSKFPSANFQGEMDCYYDFTINDSVFKMVGEDPHEGFEPNTSYLAYAGFKIGYNYESTGTLGTDVYITNIGLYDITEGKQYKIDKKGIIYATEFNSGETEVAKIYKSGLTKVNNIYEN